MTPGSHKKITSQIVESLSNNEFGMIYRVNGEPGTGKSIAVQALALFMEHWALNNNIETNYKFAILNLYDYVMKMYKYNLL